jgi:chromosome segregation ATPase
MRQGRYILGIMGGLLVASLVRTGMVQQEKTRLSEAYDEAQRLTEELTVERERLNDALGEARRTMDGQAADLVNLQQELGLIEERLTEASTEIASLKEERDTLQQQNASLTERNTTLAAQLDSTTAEKQQLEAKLSSIKELKLAIRDVKRKIRAEQVIAKRSRIESFREGDQQRLASGNRGMVIRDGKSTLGASPRLHVHVLEPQSE